MKTKQDSNYSKILENYNQLVKKLNEEAFTWPEFSRGSFKASVWDKFNPFQAASIMLSENDSFPGHKRVLFAAYCAWSVSPMFQKTIKTAAGLAMIDHISAAEKKAQKIYGDLGLLADMASRFSYIGYHFFDELYFPVGGIRIASQLASRATFKRWLREHRNEVRYLCLILDMYRFGEVAMGDRSQFVPVSNTNAMTHAHRLTSDFSERASSTIYKAWSNRKNSIAIPYAASYVKISSGESLLDVILDGRASYTTHYKYFPEWIAKAIFASTDVIGRIVKNAEVGAANLNLLPEISALPLGEVPFTSKQIDDLLRIYSRERINPKNGKVSM